MAAILDEVKIELQKKIVREQSSVEPLNTDRWVANSLLQKAIRRGEVNVARRAALSFLEQGASNLASFIIIAFEDVGAASPPPGVSPPIRAHARGQALAV